MRSQLVDLRSEVAEYEAIRSGQRSLVAIEAVDQLTYSPAASATSHAAGAYPNQRPGGAGLPG